MLLLNAKQIGQKVNRLAVEIIEHNYNESVITLAGINRNGMFFAQMLYEAMKAVEMTKVKIDLINITLSPANPLEKPIEVNRPLKSLENQTIIVVDDVLNTGRTIQYALKPLLNILPKKIEVAVLVERKHKAFPISADYVGISLATTYRENIDVQIRDRVETDRAVYLR